jgi:hypothetical protein
MSRLLLLCLLASANAFSAYASSNPLFSSPFASADTIPPTIQCPPSDSVFLASGQCDSIYFYTVMADDDQPPFILIQMSGLPSGSAFPAGTTVNSFLVTDLAANTATCSFTITVISEGNTLSCDDYVEVALGEFCEAIPQSEDFLIPPFGCSTDDVVEVDRTPPFGNGPWVVAGFGFDDLGKTYAYRVRDLPSGNSCWGEVKVVQEPPAVTCPDISVHCGVGELSPVFLNSIGISNAYPSITNDDCGFNQYTHVDIAENLPCDSSNLSGRVTRFWTVTNFSGLSSTCVQVINRVRTFDGIQFPPNDTVRCGLENNVDSTGTPFLRVNNFDFPLWPASFCEFEINFYDTVLAMPCGAAKKIARTWKFFDLCQPDPAANPFTGVQILDVVDEAGPVLVCDSAATISVVSTNCLAAVDLPDIVLTDDCSPILTVKAYWTANGMPDSLEGQISVIDSMGVFGEAANFSAGVTTTLRYVALDDCGNTGSCDVALSVWDQDPPTAKCIAFFTVTLAQDGQFFLGPDTLDAGSNDSCSNQLFFKIRRTLANNCQANNLFYDEVIFCCTDIGDTIELTRRVYDVAVPTGAVAPDFAAGQFDDCTVKVQVLDTLPLACIAPPDVVMNCTVFDPSVSDYGAPVVNCSVDSITLTVNDSQFDTTCTEGTILRTFRVFDQNGNSAECSQQITVTHVQDYFIKFPDDVIVTMCNGTGIYGEPEFLQNGCEIMEATFEDEIFTVVPDACYKIERTWTIRNTCTYDTALSVIVVPNPNPSATSNSPDNLPGPVVSPAGTPAPWAPTVVAITPGTLPTDFSTFWNADANAYQYKQIIKVIDQQKPQIDNCPSVKITFHDTTSNDQHLWNQQYWFDLLTNLNDLPDGPSPLTISASDACGADKLNINYLLFLDLDGDGAQETVVNSQNPPAPGTVRFNNANTPGYTGGTPQIFDDRPVPANDIYRWVMHQTTMGTQKTASLQWKTLAQSITSPSNPSGLPGIAPQLPYGTHKIKWFVTDGCGNEQTCEYNFTVKDGKAPTVACLQDLLVEIPLSQTATIFAPDFLNNAEDNYAPQQDLELAVRKAGTGMGFPEDANGNPQTSVTFTCADLGAQTVELWAKDFAGNAGFCLASLTFTDADSSCNTALLTVAGSLKTEIGTSVKNAEVTLSVGQLFTTTDASDMQGAFEFPQILPLAIGDYILTPFKDDEHLNGVSTFDLVLISRHILGLQPLNSPYKLIAADANKSNSITTFDIVELRKLILGIYADLPANTSWRFVDKDFIFPDTANPFILPFPETIMRNDVTTDQLNDDFVAVKIGDVNNSASDSVFAPDDRTRGVLFFKINDKKVEAGEEFTARFTAAEKASGWQFTLNLKDLEVVEVLPGEGMSRDNFAVFKDAITTSVENKASEFSIKFRARRAGQLSEMLAISSRITRAEAYQITTDDLRPTISEVALLFDNRLISKVGFELYQNQPNPFSDRTLIGFHLPETSDATLTIFDETGRVVHTQSASYARGYHSISLEKSLFNGAGVFFYKLETPTDSAVRKMFLLR